MSPGLWLTAICCVRPAPSESVRVTMTPSSTPSSRKAWGQARVFGKKTPGATGACACLDHLLREQIGCFRIAEAGVDVGDHGHDVGLEGVDLFDQRLFLRL